MGRKIKVVKKQLFGRELQLFDGGFLYDEGGTKVIEWNPNRLYKHDILFRLAFYFHPKRFFKWGSMWIFVLTNSKPYFGFNILIYKLINKKTGESKAIFSHSLGLYR